MRRASLIALSLATGMVQLSPGAKAQDAPDSGRVLSATITQRVETEDNRGLVNNPAGRTSLAETLLGLNYATSTATQNFSLGLNTSLRAIDRPNDDVEFRAGDPTGVSLNYAQEGPSTTFDMGLAMRVQRTDFEYALIDDDNNVADTETVAGNALEYTYRANLGFALATNTASVYEFALSASARDYSEDVDGNPDLNTQNSAEATAAWILRLSPLISTTLIGRYSYSKVDTAAPIETRVSDIAAGLIVTPNENLRWRSEIGYSKRKREDGNTVTSDDSGVVVNNSVRYELPDFTFTGDSRWTSAAEDPRLDVSLRVDYRLARGSFNARVFNRHRNARGGDEFQTSGLVVAWKRDLNRISRIGLEANISRQENLDDNTDPDVTRSTWTASYERDLTESLVARTGYSYRTRKDGATDADSHRLFFELGKTFQIGL